MKNIHSIMVVLLLAGSLFGQTSKMDSYSSLKLSSIKAADEISRKDLAKSYDFIQSRDNAYFIKSLVKVTGEAFEADLTARGGKVIVKAGDIWGVEIPVHAIDAVLKNDDLLRLSVARTMKTNNEKARMHTNIENLHQGETGTVLKGEGILVGIGDTGIDITHPDFSDDDGTRIKYIWDQSDVSETNIPEGYDFGREFTAEDINLDQCTHLDIHGHGTHVSGTAAGSGNGSPVHMGMAPNSDIIVAKVSREYDSKNVGSSTDVLAGVAWIFTKADEIDKPCVINLSLGFMLGPHDGTSLLAQGISNLVGPGRIVVSSAGNNGDLPIHSGTDFVAGEYLETVLMPAMNICDIMPDLCPENVPTFFALGSDMWYTANSLDSVYVTAYNPNEETGILDIVSSIGFGVDDISENTPFATQNITLGYIQLDFSNNEIAENNSGNLQVIIHNGGNVEVAVPYLFWSITVKTNREGIIHKHSSVPAPAGSGLDGMIGRQLYGDAAMTIGSPADGLNVISVGSYINRDFFVDDLGTEHDFDEEIGSISAFTSIGPTRDGRIAPIISAPGSRVISALSSGKISTSHTVDTYYRSMSGTSMAAPVVTGAVALMLQVKPDLTPDELKDIFAATSITDEFTGETPNNYVGNGKLNALAAVKYILNTNVKEYEFVSEPVGIYPNPAYDNITISNYEPGMQFIIFDAAGRALKVVDNTSEINVQDLPSGAYYLNVVSDKSSYAVPFAVSK